MATKAPNSTMEAFKPTANVTFPSAGQEMRFEEFAI
jgi:hypothetical protein